MNEKQISMLHLPVQSQQRFPTLLMYFFQVQCQQNTSSAPPLRPVYPPKSFYEIHLFTKVFSGKLNKHSYTIEKRSYVIHTSYAVTQM